MNDDELKTKASELMDAKIAPALKAHGGGAKIVKVEKGNVYVELQGGCRGCMGARMTMKHGIEQLLRSEIPAINSVIDATDH